MSAPLASQTASNAENNSIRAINKSSLICPSCGHNDVNINDEGMQLNCSNCNHSYPLIQNGKDSIPWLLEQPSIMLAEWKARLNGFLHINETEQLCLKEALKDKRVSKIGQKRFKKILQAKRDQVSQVLNIIAPLNFDVNEHVENNHAHDALQSKVPKVQGLSSYYDNIFRDWSWENGEHEELLNSVESVLEGEHSLGKILTLGSGAGRLSYDLHVSFKPELSVLIDINPLLLLTSSSIMQGKSIDLYEFPVAPIDNNSFAVVQKCSSPSIVNENINFLFADAMNPPFMNKSFNTILTPWLIDIIPQNLRDFIPRVNQVLEIGGRWLNTGSLAFLHKDPTWSYSEGEVQELLSKNGFKVISHNRKKINYLNSPLSANGRVEHVFNFSAVKFKDVAAPKKFEYLPKWAKDISKPIPKSYDVEIESSRFLLQAQVLGAVNGQRSIKELGELVAKQYSLDVQDAITAVRRIVIDHYEHYKS